MLTLSEERKFHLILAQGRESSREQKFLGTRVPGNESTRKRKFHVWNFCSWDSVSHKKLIMKLQAYGIDEKMINWIEDYSTGRSMAVRVNSKLSS